MKAIVIAGTALAIGGALYAALANPPFWVESQIRKRMESYAFDPDGLRFSDLNYSDKNREYVCGYINGKNALGGYVGQIRFAYSTKIKEIYMIGHPLSPQYAINRSGCFN